MTVAQIGRVPTGDAPTPAVRPGGLLDVAEVRDGIAWLSPADMFVSWNCLDNRVTADPCDAGALHPAKTFDSPVLVDGSTFVAYLGGACKPVIETASVRENVSRVFDLRESRFVEKQFEAAVLAAGTALTATTAAEALGTMEEALGNGYAGVGVIHMGPLVATFLLAEQLIYQEGGKFFTHLGTKVAVGTGYGSMKMYGTGEVTLYRGAKQVVDVPDTANNVATVLAERVYVAVADCVVYKIDGIPGPG
jgi:hypothetical protein